MLSAVNRLLKFLGREECRVRSLRIQRRTFREQSRELTRGEYQRLLDAAAGLGRERLALLMETICATGIRVSEVQYITVEAARAGRTEIRLKGKIRTILLPSKLCRKLLKYARKQKTASGEIFLTRSGAPVSRRQIWREMKALCKEAGVEASKVFPHNLRHLFATAFYRACRDIVKLADVLGHSSIDTTRIYLITTGAEHARQMEKLGLVT
ncbi:MAG: tyrosine-type recombinase/integrase [Oscillospiraceae bacterium]|nr:tyrosine-type recombinase/integrase [Oscillospiraceae bacterium]